MSERPETVTAARPKSERIGERITTIPLVLIADGGPTHGYAVAVVRDELIALVEALTATERRIAALEAELAVTHGTVSQC